MSKTNRFAYVIGFCMAYVYLFIMQTRIRGTFKSSRLDKDENNIPKTAKKVK